MGREIGYMTRFPEGCGAGAEMEGGTGRKEVRGQGEAKGEAMSDNPTPVTTDGPERMWLLAAMVSRREVSATKMSMVSGYRVTASEDAARGSFLRSVQEAKPGFSVDELNCMEIPASALRLALGLEGA